MVHPAVKKYVQVQPTSRRLLSSTITPNPSLKSTSCDDDKSIISSHQPTLTTSANFRDPNSSVHDLQTSLYTLLDTMTPVEFSKTLHSHIQSILNHWPPRCDINPLSTPVSTMNGSQETVTIASVMGLVKFFTINPRTAKRSRLHDQSQLSLSDLYRQLHQVEIFLTFLSVSELMQVFRARLKAPNEIVSLPNVLLGLRDVMRNKSFAPLNGPTSEESSNTGTATLLATSGSANNEVEGGLTDSRVVSNVPRCASQTVNADKDDHTDQRPCKKVKIDLESRLDDQGSSQHLKSLSMMDDGRPSYIHRRRSQEPNPNRVPSNAVHPYFARSLRKTAEYGPFPSTHTASEGRLSFTLGELAAWKGSPLMVETRRTDAPLIVSIFDENEDVQSAQLDPLPSTMLKKANIPSMDDKDLCLLDITETDPGASGTPELAQPRAFGVDGHVAADPKSLSSLMKIAPRATPSSRDTLNGLSAMEPPSVSSIAFMAAPSLSHVWHASRSPRGSRKRTSITTTGPR